MAPPALDLKNASSFRSLHAFSTAASPLRNSFSLSCRSPATPAPPSRYGPTASSSARSLSVLLSEKGGYLIDDDDDVDNDNDDDQSTEEEESPTDSTWFLPHSPGLPPPPSALRPGDDGKLGVLSAINIIVGKTMGVGAYSVPSAIFTGVGSVGMTLTLWVIGSIISFCGLSVYLDLGTAIPRSGGERVYLERIFRKPYMLATCMFMSYVVLLGFSTPNAIVLGEHALYMTDEPPSTATSNLLVRLIAVLAVSLLCYTHARHPRIGLALINTLGVAKLLILVLVVAAGVAGGLMGVGADREALLTGADVPMAGDAPSSTAQRNFRAIWAGTSTQPYDYATALLKVLYCFRGYSTANQVLSDVRNPVRTLQIAAPVALALVSVAYLAINVAFFLVVDKDEFASAGVVVAGVFFRKVFGDGLGAHVLPLFVVVSAAGNIAATSFAQARVNEELAREGVLPPFWMTPSDNKKHRGQTTPPVKGLLLHWLVSVAAILLPPPGKIFNFLVDIGGYPVSAISVAVSLGLLYLHQTPSEHWTTPCRAPRLAIVVFAASNCLLLILPWIPPRGGMAGDSDGARFPSFAYPATSLGVLGLGAGYWVWWRGSAMSQQQQQRRREAPPRSCCAGGDEVGSESSGSSDSEDLELIVVPNIGGQRQERYPKVIVEEAMVEIGGRAATCGCRACPQVRRRAVCGCPSCPTRAQTP